MELIDHGRIKRIKIPDRWIKDEPLDEWTEIVSFHSPEDSETKLSFYFRGKPIDSSSASNFQTLLSQPPHTLDTNEISKIEVIIHNASEPEYFDLKSANTDDLNGQRVLIVEGYWKLSDVDSYGIFLDSEGGGKIIDEIYFLSPPSNFRQILPQIKSCLQTIEWSNPAKFKW